MQKTLLRLCSAIALALLVAAPVPADELPEGVTATVIAEYVSRVPGVEKVRLVRVQIVPGAGFRDIEVKSEEYCELEAGTLTRTDHNAGTTDVLTVGARWAPPKGHRHTVINTGNEVADMWVYQLIEQGGEAGKM